jgi:hypothetical protein
VETKVSVELHRQEQGNHCGDRPLDWDSGGLGKPAAVLSNQPPEQRKGASGGTSCHWGRPLSSGWGTGGVLWGAWAISGTCWPNHVDFENWEGRTDPEKGLLTRPRTALLKSAVPLASA